MTPRKGDRRPKTRLVIDPYLQGHSIAELAQRMGIFYTQIYRYLKPGANPTLYFLEKLANGLSSLRNEKISVRDILKD